MTREEIIEMARQALKQEPREDWNSTAWVFADETLQAFAKLVAEKAIKEALAQPEQEPVAWWNDTGTHIDLNVSGRGTPLYTHPLQRTWVGLTAKEKHEFRYSHMTTADFIEDIEAKLKDKNTSGQE